MRQDARDGVHLFRIRVYGKRRLRQPFGYGAEYAAIHDRHVLHDFGDRPAILEKFADRSVKVQAPDAIRPSGQWVRCDAGQVE